ncbi:MAG: DUF5458 family protein [Bernardetiaceae bacterium]|jgi:hypothetical protein|nr:DUF5458 family protein [Bernardetiaceae bacterium]
MATELQGSGGYRERERVADVAQTLEQSANKLGKYGGYDLLETTIEGTQNLNPTKKARKKIFLTEADKKADRQQLKKRLELWFDLAANSESVAEMIEKSQGKAEAAINLLTENLLKTVEAVKPLETSYRSLALFYKNTESDKLKNVSIMNADMEQLTDLDNTTFIDHVAAEFKQKYDRLDLRENYSIMCLPGYLGSNKVVEKWAKICYENKVMMVTDFENLDTPDDVIDLFESANLTGGDAYRSNVIMAANWIVGRGKYQELGEDDNLYVPPSSALAGKIYSTLMSQVTAGRKHGTMNEVDGVKFQLKKSEIASMEKIGLVPMVNEYGKVMAFSAKTLFNGDNLGLQTYSVVRVFDWVTKVLIDFLNRRAFENFNSRTQADIQKQITKFLDSVTGPGKLIEKFKILRFEQDEVQKDRIHLDIYMLPYFPGKTFMIKLDGQKGLDPDSAAWAAEYQQNNA